MRTMSDGRCQMPDVRCQKDCTAAVTPAEIVGRTSKIADALPRSSFPFVSIVIPCRNEENAISGVLESLLAQDYPKERMEIIFVDGASTDRTRAVISRYLELHAPRIVLLDNPDRTAPVGFNKGISRSRGDVIFTMGAHSRYSPDYLSGVVAALCETGADAVGSVAITRPGRDTRVGRAIAACLSAGFGVGNSVMRTGTARRREADTASCPGYRRRAFERYGTFNEQMVRNQDIEFNLRLRRAGGRILVDPSVMTFYTCRSRLPELAKNSFENGYWVVRGLRLSRTPCAPRHLVPLALVSVLLAAAASGILWLPAAIVASALGLCYSAAVLSFSVATSRGHGRELLLPLLAAYPTLHLSYGLGSLWALATLWRPERKRNRGIKGQRDGVWRLGVEHGQ